MVLWAFIAIMVDNFCGRGRVVCTPGSKQSLFVVGLEDMCVLYQIIGIMGYVFDMHGRSEGLSIYDQN